MWYFCKVLKCDPQFIYPNTFIHQSLHKHSSQPVKTISAPQPMLSSSSILTPHHVGSPQCIREEAPGHSELQLQSLVSRQPYQCGSHQCTQKQPDTCWALNLDHPDKVKQACSCFSSSPSTKAIGHIQSA